MRKYVNLILCMFGMCMAPEDQWNVLNSENYENHEGWVLVHTNPAQIIEDSKLPQQTIIYKLTPISVNPNGIPNGYMCQIHIEHPIMNHLIWCMKNYKDDPDFTNFISQWKRQNENPSADFTIPDISAITNMHMRVKVDVSSGLHWNMTINFQCLSRVVSEVINRVVSEVIKDINEFLDLLNSLDKEKLRTCTHKEANDIFIKLCKNFSSNYIELLCIDDVRKFSKLNK